MSENGSKYDIEKRMDLAIRSHELHMKFIYGVRLGGLLISLVSIVVGAIMLFKGLDGSFNWTFDAPNTLRTKLTNASPGIGFALIGMIIGFVVLSRKPMTYVMDEDDDGTTMYLDESASGRLKPVSRAANKEAFKENKTWD
jgi:hypothetical protein